MSKSWISFEQVRVFHRGKFYDIGKEPQNEGQKLDPKSDKPIFRNLGFFM